MAKIDNLTVQELEWIVVAVEAVAALPSSGLPEDNVRHEEWKALVAKLKTLPPANLDASEVFDDFASWANVKPGDQVEIVVGGKTVMESMVAKEGSMGLLKKRTLDKLKEEGARQLAQQR